MNTKLLLPCGLALLLAAQTAFGFSSYPARIPNGGTLARPDSCMLCHGASGPPLNAFGNDFLNPPPGGVSLRWSAALAALDSDGDGASNGAELGDPNGTWVAGQPNPGGTVYGPGDPNSYPPLANVAPTATLTGPANGATFIAPASVTLTGNAADSDGTVTMVEFLSGDTVIGSDTTAPYSFVWNGVPAGDYSLSARATDNSGATTTSAAVSITVNPAPNVPPTVQLTGPVDGATFIAPASVTLTGNAADSDGTVTMVEFLSGDTVIGSDTTAPYSFVWNGVGVGSYTLSARATDNSGATTTSAAVSITVNPAPNVPPTVQLTGPADGATFIAPASVTLTGNAADSDGTVTMVEFLSGDTVIGSDTTAPYSFVWNGVGVGSYTLSARATDNSGGTTTSAAVSITVNPAPNVPPTVQLTGPVDGATFIAPASVTLTGNAADSDGTVTMVEFLSGDTVIGSDTTAPYSFVWNGVGVGSYTLSARATDNSGATTTSAAVSITVNPAPNVPPTVQLTGPVDGATFIAPASVTLTGNAADSDGTVTVVEFLSGDTVIGSDTTAPYSFVWNGVPAGDYSLSARATDNSGAATTSAAISITVNGVIIAPTITQQPESRSVAAGETVTFQVEATGAQPLSYQWQKDGANLANAGNISGATSAILTVANVTTADAGSYRAVVDNAANQPATSDAATLTVSGEPTPLTITLAAPDDGASFNAPADIELSASVSPQDTAAAVEFFEGTNLLATLTAPPFAVTVTNVPEGVYVFAARVTDTQGAVAVSAAATVHVLPPGANQSPLVRILRPHEGSRFRNGQNVIIVAEASDADGTVQSVEFFAGDESLGLGTMVVRGDDDEGEGDHEREHRGEVQPEQEQEHAPLWVLTWSGAPTGEHLITAVATDDQGAATASVPVTITVQPPPLPRVRISAPDSRASARGTNINTATFEVRRSTADGPMQVSYTVAGTAANGLDYVALPGTVTIPAGARAIRFRVIPLPVQLSPDQRSRSLTVVLTLLPDSATPPSYAIEGRSSARATIYQTQAGGRSRD